MPIGWKRLACVAGGAAVALMTGRGAQAAEFDFTFHHFLGPKSPAQTQMIEPWVKRIEDASDGRVDIEIYPSMSLGGRPPELVQQARDGVVDLIWVVNGYTAGQFPRTEVFELPFIHTNDPVATNLAMHDLYDEYLAEEYTGLEPMFLHVHAGQAIQTVDFPVHKPEDLAGKKMRIPTRTGAWVIEALDANPVGMPVPELPQALSKKVVDGAFIPWEIIPALKLQDLTDYQIEGADQTRFGTTTFQVSMNKQRWDSLPDDIKQIFRDNSGEEWLKEIGKIWREIDNHGIEVATEAGNEHIVLSEEETQAFKEKLEPVVQRWIDDVSASGIDGEKLVEEARAAMKKHSSQ